jgi:hypothetical protein
MLPAIHTTSQTAWGAHASGAGRRMRAHAAGAATARAGSSRLGLHVASMCADAEPRSLRSGLLRVRQLGSEAVITVVRLRGGAHPAA